MTPAVGQGSARPGPLAGVRVLDLSSVVFGPLASQALADYGAEVVKIEPPGGDSTRHTGPAVEPGMAAMFMGCNRSKKSVVLDLKQPLARQALHALLATADVFMHSMRPQKIARLGLDADSLRARYPHLVYAGLHGFGEDGPYAGLPAYDDVIQGMSGLADLMQRQTGEARYLPTIAADKTCALVAAQAILAALFARERTGQGSFVEIPMFETMVGFNLVEHFYGMHFTPALSGAGYPRVMAPWRKPYRTLDGHVCLMPYTDAHWRRFFDAVDQPQLAQDARFASQDSRTQHIAALLEILSAQVAQHDTRHWLDTCRRLEIPAAPVARLDELPQDRHLQATGFFTHLQDRAMGEVRLARSSVRFDGAPPPVSMPPRLGEHTHALLRDAGLDDADLAQLQPLEHCT
ncbi:Crotonobetainyl-CoA:carnitine CoA-transferase CaiB [Oryzisolibacter propanilivorax]|uniref:Crotonobetainyl-CoA:carnitine CoA-transferase CaiB n=1 Tax=Oryzisolibacter propanilivorax TaxID=1527607 RepID=A0A1G9Q3S4_9BURK|nr:CoA transferase [Oryzisolibacter propanilivorax]SDM05563.1 Crotonobetainyl-CoA:carnitine CoA-transferase CaiB [Oryzisolibacter propanilivorax]